MNILSIKPKRNKSSFYEDHVIYREDGKAKIRGRYFLIAAALIWISGNYFIFHVLTRPH